MMNPRNDKRQNKFKNINGVYLLKELFFETANNKDNVLYTLKNQAHEGYPSLRECFLSANDVTEYRFAVEYLDGWDHWCLLRECTWFKDYLVKWREELEVRQRSDALATIMEKASGNSREAFAAAKYIADGWGTPKTGNARGRPSKADISRAAHEQVSERKRLEEDFLRIVQ